MNRLAFVAASAVAVTLGPSLAAQEFRLTVENIMRGPDLVGTSPSNVRFSADGRHVYFRWRSPGADTLDQDYRAAVAGGAPERLPRRVVDTIPMATGAWSPDQRRQVVALGGDLYLVDRAGAKRRLTQTTGAESAPSWSADGRTVHFTRDNNAWGLELEGGRLTQLTDIRRGSEPRKAADPVGQKKFLRDQQRELFDFIRRQVAEEQLRADTDTTAAKPLWLAERQSVARLEVAPDGRFVLLTLTERVRGDSVDGRQVAMPVWVNQAGYVETQQIRTKVGDAQSRQKAALLEVATGKTTWINWEGAGSREQDVAGIAVSRNGRHALLRVATADYNDAWLVVIDLPSLEKRAVAHLHDDAWLDGPLGFTAGWLRDGATVYYGSEETGYAHLYTVAAAGGTPKPLTSGRWEVVDAQLSPDGRTIYLHTNEGDFAQVHFYALDVASGRRTQLTTAEGRQDVVVSPDGRLLAVLHSSANDPPELYLQPSRAGAPAPPMRPVTESTTPEFRRFAW
ncbi:MAG: DPP IV N-terminal domain-containing protein, partial [Gemmatimonadales bacterium]